MVIQQCLGDALWLGHEGSRDGLLGPCHSQESSPEVSLRIGGHGDELSGGGHRGCR